LIPASTDDLFKQYDGVFWVVVALYDEDYDSQISIEYYDLFNRYMGDNPIVVEISGTSIEFKEIIV